MSISMSCMKVLSLSCSTLNEVSSRLICDEERINLCADESTNIRIQAANQLIQSDDEGKSQMVLKPCVAREHTSAKSDDCFFSWVMPSQVEEHRGVFRLSHPMEHGIVKNWSDMEKVSLSTRLMPALRGRMCAKYSFALRGLHASHITTEMEDRNHV